MNLDKDGRIRAYDYKGKWFILMDEDRADFHDYERKEVNVEYVMNDGLKEHVYNCLYYGISAYVGNDKELNEKIKNLQALKDRE